MPATPPVQAKTHAFLPVSSSARARGKEALIAWICLVMLLFGVTGMLSSNFDVPDASSPLPAPALASPASLSTDAPDTAGSIGTPDSTDTSSGLPSGASTPGSADGVGASDLTSLGTNAQGYREYKNSVDGSVLIFIPGGIFTMGSQKGHRDERPTAPVIVKDFFLAKYPVTNAQWRQFVAATGYVTDAEVDGGVVWGQRRFVRMPGACWKTPEGDGIACEDSAPVVQVSWKDAQAYAKGAGLGLKTEAEWEYVARGPGGYRYPWGNKWDGHRCFSGRVARWVSESLPHQPDT